MLALATVPGSSPTASGQAGGDKDPVIPIIQMQTVSLDSAIENLGRQAGLNYILDPKVARPSYGSDGKFVPPPSVTFHWENLTAKQALTRLLGEHGLHAVESPVSSVTRICSTNQTATAVAKAWVTSGTNAIIPLISMQALPLDVAIANLAAGAQLSVVLDPKLTQPAFTPGKPFVSPPTVSFRWEKLTARQAIAALCENYDLRLVPNAPDGSTRIIAAQTGGDKPGQSEKPPLPK